ncbi:unnamed protein product [Amoebophrya sp. A25]|nr:unnamed protein product [Amoebophrya sp. A25]|eukprot:GSA25T00012815001.1
MPVLTIPQRLTRIGGFKNVLVVVSSALVFSAPLLGHAQQEEAGYVPLYPPLTPEAEGKCHFHSQAGHKPVDPADLKRGRTFGNYKQDQFVFEEILGGRIDRSTCQPISCETLRCPFTSESVVCDCVSPKAEFFGLHFLEIGAGDGPWRGICVEGSPLAYDHLVRQRPKCVNINAAVGFDGMDTKWQLLVDLLGSSSSGSAGAASRLVKTTEEKKNHEDDVVATAQNDILALLAAVTSLPGVGVENEEKKLIAGTTTRTQRSAQQQLLTEKARNSLIEATRVLLRERRSAEAGFAVFEDPEKFAFHPPSTYDFLTFRGPGQQNSNKNDPKAAPEQEEDWQTSVSCVLGSEGMCRSWETVNEFIASQKNVTTERDPVSIFSLRTLFEYVAAAMPSFDLARFGWISIDVEGAELETLRTIPLGNGTRGASLSRRTSSSRVISIEGPHTGRRFQKHKYAWWLRNRGYRLRELGNEPSADWWFVNQERSHQTHSTDP